jgi:DNA polymerase-3 subunit delta
MKLQAYKIDGFINSEITGFDGVLLYGPDEGLAAERKNNIVKKILGEGFDPFLFSDFNAGDLKKDEQKLVNEINAISLIPGRRLIVLSGAGNTQTKIISSALENKKSDSFLVVLANDLAPSGSLRKFFETEKNVASMPCYADSKEQVVGILRAEFKDYEVNFETLDYIASNISGNRNLIRSEIQKIKVFYGDKREIQQSDIVNLISSNNNSDFQDFANNVMDKNADRAIKILEELLSQNFPAMTLTRVLINYLERISETQSNMQNGENFDGAIRKLRPPVFFTQKDILRRHVNLWKPATINMLLEKVFELEKTLKSSSYVKADHLFKFFVLFVAK